MEITNGRQTLAAHPRCYDREQDLLNPLHYLPLLDRRPGAWDQAAPIKTWRQRWPEVYARYLEALKRRFSSSEATRVFVRILRLHEDHNDSVISEALEEALHCHRYEAAGVNQLVLRILEQRTGSRAHGPIGELEDTPSLPFSVQQVAWPEVHPYNVLLSTSAQEHQTRAPGRRCIIGIEIRLAVGLSHTHPDEAGWEKHWSTHSADPKIQRYVDMRTNVYIGRRKWHRHLGEEDLGTHEHTLVTTRVDTALGTKALDYETVIATSEGDIHVRGTVDGMVTVYSAGHIWIDDDIVYADDPRDGESDDILGLMAYKSVTVTDNAANNDGHVWIDATIGSMTTELPPGADGNYASYEKCFHVENFDTRIPSVRRSIP